MKKSEIFAFIMGLIGLAADLITLFQFSLLHSRGLPVNELNVTSEFEVITLLTLIYSWFIISWMLVRRHWVKTQIGEKGDFSFHMPISKNEFAKRVVSTVGAIGIIAFSLSLLLPVNHRLAGLSWPAWCLAILGANVTGVIVVGLLIYVVILFLMPIIYADMKRLAD